MGQKKRPALANRSLGDWLTGGKETEIQNLSQYHECGKFET